MVMAGKDEPDEVVKDGFMVKRSQNKKRFTPINYKQRWFVLTRQHLTYYDSDGEVSPIIINNGSLLSGWGATPDGLYNSVKAVTIRAGKVGWVSRVTEVFFRR